MLQYLSWPPISPSPDTLLVLYHHRQYWSLSSISTDYSTPDPRESQHIIRTPFWQLTSYFYQHNIYYHQLGQNSFQTWGSSFTGSVHFDCFRSPINILWYLGSLGQNAVFVLHTMQGIHFGTFALLCSARVACCCRMQPWQNQWSHDFDELRTGKRILSSLFFISVEYSDLQISQLMCS